VTSFHEKEEKKETKLKFSGFTIYSISSFQASLDFEYQMKKSK
jgi:hypothetical protein